MSNVLLYENSETAKSQFLEECAEDCSQDFTLHVTGVAHVIQFYMPVDLDENVLKIGNSGNSHLFNLTNVIYSGRAKWTISWAHSGRKKHYCLLLLIFSRKFAIQHSLIAVKVI